MSPRWISTWVRLVVTALVLLSMIGAPATSNDDRPEWRVLATKELANIMGRCCDFDSVCSVEPDGVQSCQVPDGCTACYNVGSCAQNADYVYTQNTLFAANAGAGQQNLYPGAEAVDCGQVAFCMQADFQKGMTCGGTAQMPKCVTGAGQCRVCKPQVSGSMIQQISEICLDCPQ